MFSVLFVVTCHLETFNTSPVGNETMSSVKKKYSKLWATHAMHRQIKIFIEYSQCVTEHSKFDRVIPEGCPCFV